MKIIYGTDTGSIEDYNQVVLLEVPDNLDADELQEWLESTEFEDNAQCVVGIEDVLTTLHTVLKASGIRGHTALWSINDAMRDALAANDDSPSLNIPWIDIKESLQLIHAAEGVPADTSTTIINSLFDAIDNNS